MRENVGIRERLIVALREGGMEKVTPAEALVAAHLIAGRTNKEIAIYVELSVNTVRLHLRNMRNRLGFGTPASQVERAILREIALGNTVKKTAAVLGIGKKTVETHLCALRAKFGAHNMVQLVNATRKGA